MFARNIPIAAFLIICIFSFLCCNNVDNNKISGLWKLHTMETRDSVSGIWTDYKNGMQGYLMYDNLENMSLYLSTKDYEKTDLSFANFSDTISLDKLKYLTGSYFYLGTYSVDHTNNIVSHTRKAHSNPNDWNKTVQRKFRFSNDTLIITPVEAKNARLRLKWLKESE